MGTLRFLAAALLLTCLARFSLAETFTVNSTADAGDFDLKDNVADADATAAGNQVTLRCAIENANLTPAPDEIVFDIPASDAGHRYYKNDGVAGDVTLMNVTATSAEDDSTIEDIDPDCKRSWFSVAIKSALPPVNAPLTIDGLKQKGASPDALRIEIDGTEASEAAVLSIGQRGDPYLPGPRLAADKCTLRGLMLTRFNNNFSPAVAMQASDGAVESCTIGLDPSGLRAKSDFYGVLISPAPNAAPTEAVTSNRVEKCVIGGNYRAGIAIIGNANGSNVRGCFIGADRAGKKRIPNGHGVHIGGVASSNLIGGDKEGDGNVIAFNSKDGVNIATLLEQDGADNAIVGNIIHSNVALGINLAKAPEGANDVTLNDKGDIDEGPNHLQNTPELTAASTMSFLSVLKVAKTNIKGSLKSNPDTKYRIEIFTSPKADASGYGEGQRRLAYVEVNTGPTRIADFELVMHGGAVPADHVVTATATEIAADGKFKNTSEFSAAIAIKDVLPSWLWSVVLGVALIGIVLILRAKRQRRLPPPVRPVETTPAA